MNILEKTVLRTANSIWHNFVSRLNAGNGRDQYHLRLGPYRSVQKRDDGHYRCLPGSSDGWGATYMDFRDVYLEKEKTTLVDSSFAEDRIVEAFAREYSNETDKPLEVTAEFSYEETKRQIRSFSRAFELEIKRSYSASATVGIASVNADTSIRTAFSVQKSGENASETTVRRVEKYPFTIPPKSRQRFVQQETRGTLYHKIRRSGLINAKITLESKKNFKPSFENIDEIIDIAADYPGGRHRAFDTFRESPVTLELDGVRYLEQDMTIEIPHVALGRAIVLDLPAGES